jgi:hypothetical protein
MPAPQDRSLVGAILAAGPGREAGARHPGFFDDAGDGLDHSTVLDCTPELAAEIEDCLKTAMAKGVVRYGAHRQDAAMMTCFTPSPVNPNHVHFIDGAQDGHALAVTALKESSGRE